MAKAKNKEQYALHWKNEVSNILYGPLMDVSMHHSLSNRIRISVTKLCIEIDEVADILEKEGAFAPKEDS